MCYLVNEIMQKKSMNKIDSKELIKQLKEVERFHLLVQEMLQIKLKRVWQVYLKLREMQKLLIY